MCAVFGEPSGLRICSQLPWSAVIRHAPPCGQDCRHDSGKTFVDRLHRLDSGGDHAGVPDHVGIGEIQDDEVVISEAGQHFIGHFRARSFPA